MKSIHLNSQEAYDIWSRDYDAFDNPMLAMVDRAFELQALGTSGKQVVELGCGTGRNVERVLLEGASSYIGLDQSEGMLEKARAKNPVARFQSADLLKKLPLKDQSADLVLVTLVFEHLEQVEPVLKEIARILKPGGQLRVLEIHADLVTTGTQAHFQEGDRTIVLPSFPHGENEWRESLNKSGFKFVINSLSPDSAAIAKTAKLKKHLGRNVLIDIRAEGRG